MIKYILAAVVLFAFMQIIPYGKDHTNPKVVKEVKWDSAQTKKLFYRACGDCHSNITKWPWYSKVAPISWLVASDVQEGRDHLNVSMWGLQRKNKGNEAAKALKEGDMPPWIFTVNHPEARLTDSEKQILVRGLEKTFGKK